MKKTMITAGTILLFATSLLFLSGCRNAMQQPPPEMVGPGMGVLTLSIGHENLARTIMPGNVAIGDFTHFRIVLTPGTGNTFAGGFLETVFYDDDDPTDPAPISGPIPNIPVGYWDVVITGYTGLGAFTAGAFIARFEEEDFEVEDGANTLTAVLTPIFTGGVGVTGTFQWDITAPAGTVGTIRVTPGVYPATYTEVAFYPTGTMTDLRVGNHTVVLELTNDGGIGEATITSAMQIFQNMTSIWDDLTVTPAMFLYPLEEIIFRARSGGTWNFETGVAAGITSAHFALIGIDGLGGYDIVDDIQYAFNTISVTAGVDVITGTYNMDRLEQLADAAAIYLNEAIRIMPTGTATERTAVETAINALAVNSPVTIGFDWDDHIDYGDPLVVTVGSYYEVTIEFTHETGDLEVTISIGTNFTFTNAAGGFAFDPVPTISYLSLMTGGPADGPLPVTVTVTGGTSAVVNGTSVTMTSGSFELTYSLVEIGPNSLTLFFTAIPSGRTYSVTLPLVVAP